MIEDISRREFLKTATGIPVLADSLSKVDLVDIPGNYKILEKVSEEDIRSLNAINKNGSLNDTKKYLNHHGKIKKEINIEKFSEIMYVHSFEKKSAKFGMTFFLNNRGFSFSSKHIFNDYLENPENGLILVYSPQKKFVERGRLLTYPEDDDTALLKIKIPENYFVKPTYITHGIINYGDWIYTTTYENTDYIRSKLAREVFDAYQNNQKYLKPSEDLIIRPNICQIIDEKKFGFQNRNSLKGGEFIGISSLPEGGCGSHLLNLKHDLIGVSTGTGTIKTKLNVIDIIRLTGNQKIRKMLENYINAH